MTAKIAYALTAAMFVLATVTACNDSTSASDNGSEITSSPSAEDGRE